MVVSGTTENASERISVLNPQFMDHATFSVFHSTFCRVEAVSRLHGISQYESYHTSLKFSDGDVEVMQS